MPLSKRATSGKRSTASGRARSTRSATSGRRETRRRTSFVDQQQGEDEDAPRSSTRRQTARAASARHGGGRGKDGGNNNLMLYGAIGGVVLLVIIAIAASGQSSGKSPAPAARKPQAAAPAPAKPSPAKKKGAKDDTPAWYKGPPKLDHVDDDKWDKAHKDTSVKNDLSANEIAAKMTEARKLMKQVDATRKSDERNELRRKVNAICNEVINSRNATDADRAAAQKIKWMAEKSQGVK